MVRAAESGRRQPLDLRLLPAACAGWGAALLVLPAEAGAALGLGAVLMGTAVLMGAALCLVPRGQGARWWALCLQVTLSIAVAGAVALSAGHVHHTMETSGWSDAVQDGAPVHVTLRVTEDAVPVGGPTVDRPGQVRVRAVVHTAALPEREERTEVGADVVLLAPSEPEDTAAEWVAGKRYSGWVSTTATEGVDRASALLVPLGPDELSAEPADRWSQVSSGFNALRAGAMSSSSHAVGEGPSLLPGVVMGDRSRQSQELTDAMNVSGLSHMTVVSGTHCALVMGALLGGLRIFRVPRWASPVVLLMGLVLYVMLVQPAPSVIRAAVMGAIGALAVFAGRGRASSALLCLCVAVLLIYSPWFAVEPAFQLSVVATAGIVLIGVRLKSMLQRIMPGWVAGPLSLAISAQIFVTPVLLPIAEGVTLYSIPANIIAGPLLPLATVPGTLAAVLSTTLPWVSVALMWMAGWSAAGIALVGYAAASLPHALAPWPQGWLGWLMAAAYCAAAIMICVLIVQRRFPKVSEAGVLSAATGMMISVLVPWSGPFVNGVPQDWRYALCDVGQGDMMVIRTAESAGLVIDAGEDPDLARDCLHTLRIDTVEVLMISHEHFDHYGGSPGVLESAEVESVLYSGSADWSAETALEELHGPLEIPVRRAEVGQSWSHQDGFPVRWTVWSAPDYHSNPNNNSKVVLVEVWEEEKPAGAVGSANDPLRLLATGDLEEEITSLMLRADALPEHIDVLKVSHHGAANSGTEILQHTQPDSALIGVGEDNTYGHPDSGILNELQELGAAVYRTDKHGTVVFSLGSEGVEAEKVGD